MSDLPTSGRAELLQGAAIDRVVADWRALALALGRPNALPEWALAVEPQRDALRIVTLRDGAGDLTGLLPFVRSVRPWGVELGSLGAELAEGFGMLARPGWEAALALQARPLLRDSEPALAAIRLASHPSDEAWGARLSCGVPRTRPVPVLRKVAPYIALDDATFDAWLGGKSRNFRRAIVRAERGLARVSGRIVMVDDPGSLAAELECFVRLHRHRWHQRGGTGVLVPHVEAAIGRAAGPLLAQGNLRLWTVKQDGETVASLLCLVAGPVLLTWLGGFDERGAASNGAFLLRAAALRDAFGLGCARVDLGTGAGGFKERLATGSRAIEESVVHEPGWRGTIAGAVTGSRIAGLRLRAAMSPEMRQRLRTVRRMPERVRGARQ